MVISYHRNEGSVTNEISSMPPEIYIWNSVIKFDVYFEMWNLKYEIWLKLSKKPSLISRNIMAIYLWFFTNKKKSTFLRIFLYFIMKPIFARVSTTLTKFKLSVNFSKQVIICLHWFDTLLKWINISCNNCYISVKVISVWKSLGTE